jgi:hypothetical protein
MSNQSRSVVGLVQDVEFMIVHPLKWSNCERCVESVKRLEVIKTMSVCDAKPVLIKDSGKPQSVSYRFDLEERERLWGQTGDVDGKSGWIETNRQHDDKEMIARQAILAMVSLFHAGCELGSVACQS